MALRWLRVALPRRLLGAYLLAGDDEEPADGAEDEEGHERGENLADYHKRDDGAADFGDERPEPVAGIRD